MTCRSVRHCESSAAVLCHQFPAVNIFTTIFFTAIWTRLFPTMSIHEKQIKIKKIKLLTCTYTWILKQTVNVSYLQWNYLLHFYYICSERIFKIGQHSPKLCLTLEWHVFLTHGVLIIKIRYNKVKHPNTNYLPQPEMFLPAQQSRRRWNILPRQLLTSWKHREAHPLTSSTISEEL